MNKDEVIEMTLPRLRAVYFTLIGLYWFSTALVASLYVLFLMARGLDLATVGVWSGINALTVILLEIPTGGLADTWGRGRTFAAANIVTALSLALMVAGPGTAVLFFGAALFGAGRALSSGSLEAWFVDQVKLLAPERDIEAELGPAGAVMLLAVAAGSILGSGLPGALRGMPLPRGWSTLAWPLVFDIAIKILTAVLAVILVREPRRHGSPFRAIASALGEAPELARTVRRTLTERRSLALLFIGGAAIFLASGAVESFWQPRFRSLDPEKGFGIEFGVVMAAAYLAGAAVSLLAPRISRLLGGRRDRTAALFALAASSGMLLLALAGGRGSTAAAMMLVYGAAEGCAVPRKAMLNDHIPARARATMLSVDSLATYLGFAGVALLGFMARSRGIPAVWVIAAGVVAATIWVYPRFIRVARDESSGIIPENREESA